MRRVLAVSFIGALATGCAGSELTRPPTDADAPSAPEPSSAKVPVVTLNFAAPLDDAIERLVPALGPAGVALGAPLKQLRASAVKLDPRLLDATRRQLDALIATLPAELQPDADAIRLSLDALATSLAR